MKIVFFGSSNFGVPALKAISATSHKIIAVVTQPDKAKGRHLFESSTAIKETALSLGFKIYQPQKVNRSEVVKFLTDLNPDLFIVIAYGQILGADILHIPKIFSINLHASLLPKYRGAAPINWAVINGETKTGLTIIKMNEAMDAGEIVLNKSIAIDSSDTAVSLERKLAREGASLLLECLEGIDKKTFQLTPQDSAEVSLAPKLKKKDGLIDWHKEAQEVQNLIRGTFDWPGAFTYYKGKLLKIYKATVAQLPSCPVAQLPGEIMQVSKEGIVVVTGRRSLIIEELQLEGKRRMKAEEFIAGHKISPGDRLGYIVA